MLPEITLPCAGRAALRLRGLNPAGVGKSISITVLRVKRLSLGRRGCSKSNGGQGFPAAHDARGPRGRCRPNPREPARRRPSPHPGRTAPRPLRCSLTRSKGPHRPMLRGVPCRTRRRVRIVQPEQPRRPPEGLSRLGGVFPAPFGLGLVRVRRHCAAGGSARGESKVWRALVVLSAGSGADGASATGPRAGRHLAGRRTRRLDRRRALRRILAGERSQAGCSLFMVRGEPTVGTATGVTGRLVQ